MWCHNNGFIKRTVHIHRKTLILYWEYVFFWERVVKQFHLFFLPTETHHCYLELKEKNLCKCYIISKELNILALVVRSKIELGCPRKGNLWDILFRAAKTLYLMNLLVDQANAGAKYEFCYVFMVKVKFLKSKFQN